MRERGQYQLQLMKTRSSSGVGQKIELAFDLETLRITDPNPEGDSQSYRPSNPQPSPNDIMSKLKTTSIVTDSTNDKVHSEVDTVNKAIKVDVKSAKLNSLLSSIKAQNMNK